MNEPATTPPAPEEPPFLKEVNRQDFRDFIATADKEGRRRWVYPKKPSGRFYRWRKQLSWFLLALMFAGPFVKLNGNPLLMINIVERRFSILGRIFWPQDMALFAIAVLLFITGIIVFSSAFGRLWCGWTCPQTLLMEMVFRRIEYFVEGDSHQQRALNKAPWTAEKVFLKSGKHAIFFLLSFIIGNTLLSYIIGIDQLFAIVTDNPRHHLEGLAAMLAFTFVFYAIFARFREQACVFICPYGRFQSTILDENTLVVAYDYVRGEMRAPLGRGKVRGSRRSGGLGDCINCRQCVSVCPTGIDIRNGTQMECVNCTACIDACDTVMDKIGWPRGLVRFASLNSIEKGTKLKVTSRMIGYTVLLGLLGLGLAALIFTRSNVETTFLRAPGSLFQTMPNGDIENLYIVQLVNKTSRDLPVELKLEGTAGKLEIMSGERLVVPREQLLETSVLIELPPKALSGDDTKLTVGVYSEGKLLKQIHTAFVGPSQ